jgi:hypothetical protein
MDSQFGWVSLSGSIDEQADKIFSTQQKNLPFQVSRRKNSCKDRRQVPTVCAKSSAIGKNCLVFINIDFMGGASPLFFAKKLGNVKKVSYLCIIKIITDMHSLDTIIKQFKTISTQFKWDSVEYAYYKAIIQFLILENKYPEIVKSSGKPLYHYFQYNLPQSGHDYFTFLYNVYNPVRFAVETFDSIEEIRLELSKK